MGSAAIPGYAATTPVSKAVALVMGMLLSIAAVILVVAGIITLLSGSVITGIALIVIGCVVGPGGYSISRR